MRIVTSSIPSLIGMEVRSSSVGYCSRKRLKERKLSCFVYWVDKISGKREALMDLKVGFKCTSNMRGRIRSIMLLWKVL
uniref:Uncharacterized protein n=1 Tax=Salix viminalis TaxID=40686 RepID=A0A6N2LEJ9_SALVM